MADKLTKYEKETIINFNQEEQTASFYTCDEAWIRKMDALMKNDQRISIETQNDISKTYIIPKKSVKVRMPRIITGEKRKELILRGKHLSNFNKPKK